MGIDRTREEDTGMNFEIGQRVRIVGPTIFNEMHHIGKCFVFGEKDDPGWSKTGMHKLCGYSKYNCRHIWPAASLELAEPEYVTDEPPTAHRLAALQYQCQKNDSKIDELESRAVGRFKDIEKRLQALEGKAPEATSAFSLGMPISAGNRKLRSWCLSETTKLRSLVLQPDVSSKPGIPRQRTANPSPCASTVPAVAVVTGMCS